MYVCNLLLKHPLPIPSGSGGVCHPHYIFALCSYYPKVRGACCPTDRPARDLPPNQANLSPNRTDTEIRSPESGTSPPPTSSPGKAHEQRKAI